MPPLTPANIKVRRLALWGCSFAGLIAVGALAFNSGLIGFDLQNVRGQRFQEIDSGFPFVHRNSIALILLLMSFTGIMHAFRREFRIPAVVLSLVSLAALFLVFHGGIESGF